MAELVMVVDPRRAVVPVNHLAARFVPADGGAERLSEADFVARPPAGWDNFQFLMWQDQSAAALAALPGLGVTGTAVLRPLLQAGPAAVQKRLAAGLRFYTENLATDLYASYHRFTPGLPVTWRFDAARAAHRAAPGDLSVFERSPSLADPAWLGTVSARLEDIAWRTAPYRPLFHNLADEAGIADLAAAWDFDLSPTSLAAMRVWLAERYGDLGTLNQVWGSRFASWDEVRPSLTDAAVADDRAVPAWMDFKAWMDVAFARAIRAGTDAVHRGDPHALAALEGAQVPGWGGYDYGWLAGAVDVMEIYDAGNAVEIARSINPGLRVLTTVFEGEAAARQLWHEVLLGGRGAVLWDDTHDFVTEAGQAGPRGRALAPLLRELGGAVGAQILAATPPPAQVAILYSQSSFRMQWLLDRRASGTPWQDRDAAAEFDGDNAWRAANRQASTAFANFGVPVRWVTPETLVAGGLGGDGTRVLVLPDSLVLSDAEVAAIHRFAAAGGRVVADGVPGIRDGFGRARAQPPLDDLVAAGALQYPKTLRVVGAELPEFAELLQGAGVGRAVECFDATGLPARDLDIRLLRSGPLQLIAVQSLTSEQKVELRLARAPTGSDPQWFWWFPGSGAYFELPAAGEGAPRKGAVVTLSASEPLIIALSDEEPAPIIFNGPSQASRGDLVAYRLKQTQHEHPATITSFVQIDVEDPFGQKQPRLSETMRVPPGGATWRLRLAANDPPGEWKIQFWNATLGDVVTATLIVN